MTGFLRLATKMAMNRAARTAERRPRRVPLSRLTGARPTGAAILRRVGRLGQFGNEGAQRYRAAAGHTVQRFGIGLPDRAVTDRFVDLPVTFGQLAPRQPPMPLDGADAPALTGAAAVLCGDNHLDRLARARHPGCAVETARATVRAEKPADGAACSGAG
jgi:hypothetical protein